MAILIDSAELAGLAIEGPLYGIFLCLFAVCAYDLHRRRARDIQLSWPMVLAGVLLITLATARFIVDVTYIFIAFIGTDPRDARLAFLQDVTQQVFITKHSLFITSLLVGDLFVNYRCWIVWGKNIWVVVVPVALSVLAAGSGYYSLWAYTHLTDQSIFAQQQPLKLFFSSSLVANAMATSLLAFRIWRMDRAGVHALDANASEHTFTPVVRIVLESGLINAAFLFAFVMTLASGSLSLEIMSEMGTPMCGIIFSIVIFRVSLRRKHEGQTTTRAISTLSWAAAIKSRFGRATTAASTTMSTDATHYDRRPAPAPSATPLRVLVHDRNNTWTGTGKGDDPYARSVSGDTASHFV